MKKPAEEEKHYRFFVASIAANVKPMLKPATRQAMPTRM
jgi:hypothetical protein